MAKQGGHRLARTAASLQKVAPRRPTEYRLACIMLYNEAARYAPFTLWTHRSSSSELPLSGSGPGRNENGGGSGAFNVAWVSVAVLEAYETRFAIPTIAPASLSRGNLELSLSWRIYDLTITRLPQKQD